MKLLVSWSCRGKSVSSWIARINIYSGLMTSSKNMVSNIFSRLIEKALIFRDQPMMETVEVKEREESEQVELT